MKLQYDDLVVGSGVSGMTVSLLLAGTGRRVLLLEKSNAVGGSMQRFRRNSVPFDTGFHFTTNFTGCMGDMIRMLGLEDELDAFPSARMSSSAAGDAGFRADATVHVLIFAESFPEKRKKSAVISRRRKEFTTIPLCSICAPPADLRRAQFLDEDFISLADYLDSLGVSGELRAILASFRHLPRNSAFGDFSCGPLPCQLRTA